MSFLRLKLRTLLIVVALICVGLALDQASTKSASEFCKTVKSTHGAGVLGLNKPSAEGKFAERVKCKILQPSVLERITFCRTVSIDYTRSVRLNTPTYSWTQYNCNSTFKNSLFGFFNFIAYATTGIYFLLITNLSCVESCCDKTSFPR